MKMLKNLLFTIILMVGCSLVAFGQSNDNRNPPPKEGEKPKIKIVPKNDDKTKDSPKNTNPDYDKPKKPETES